MSDQIVPSEQEIKAGAEILADRAELTWKGAGLVIATHTRHNGKDAKEWAELWHEMSGLKELNYHRAEAAARELAEIRKVDHELNAADELIKCERELAQLTADHDKVMLRHNEILDELAAAIRRYERAELAADFERLNKMEAENAEYKIKLAEFIAIRHFQCGYCGEIVEAPDSRTDKAAPITWEQCIEAKSAHAKVCQKHPMRAVESELATVRAERDKMRAVVENVQELLVEHMAWQTDFALLNPSSPAYNKGYRPEYSKATNAMCKALAAYAAIRKVTP